jgi:hypothetical protein
MVTSERQAEPGEVCTCGRQAVKVFCWNDRNPVGWCGLSDGGDSRGPCPFCGGGRHEIGRCPSYELSPDWAQPGAEFD